MQQLFRVRIYADQPINVEFYSDSFVHLFEIHQLSERSLIRLANLKEIEH